MGIDSYAFAFTRIYESLFGTVRESGLLIRRYLSTSARQYSTGLLSTHRFKVRRYC
jgi:hypothetical protein